jgi:uncharacterized protein (TIGR03437 family)
VRGRITSLDAAQRRAATLLIPGALLLALVLPSRAQVNLNCLGTDEFEVAQPPMMTCTANGGTMPYIYSITGGALPDGVSLDAASGRLTGSPRVAGSYSFEVTVTDADGAKGTSQVSGTVYPSALIGCSGATTEVGSPYVALCVSQDGAPPVGLTLEPVNPIPGGTVNHPLPGMIEIAGLATSAGVYSYTGTLADRAGVLLTLPVTITVYPALTITCDQTDGPTAAGVPYSVTCQPADGIPPYSWFLYGSLPPGLSVNWFPGGTSIAVVSGAPTSGGAYSFGLEARDSLHDYQYKPTPRTVTQMFTGFISGPITNPPKLTSVTPTSIPAGSPDTAVDFNGSNLIANCYGTWDGNPLITGFFSTGIVESTVPWNYLSAPDTIHQLKLNCPGSPDIPGVPISVTAPRIVSLVPDSVPAGSGPFTLVVKGSGFVYGAALNWSLTPLTTTFISPTQLSAVIPVELLKVEADYYIGESNPHDAKSPDTPLFVVGTQFISRLSPASATAGGKDFLLTVTGDGFRESCSVIWDTQFLNSAYVSVHQLTTTISASMIARAGAVPISVGCSGVRSNTVNYSVNGPIVDSLVPSAAPLGAGDTPLTVTGSNFAAGAVVRWNEVSLPTTWKSATQLTTVIPALNLTRAGNFSVSVANPDGGISTNIAFAVAGGTTPFIQAVYNPANKQPVLTPGAPTFLEGLRLASDTFSASSAPWPTSMGGVGVTINGTPAPLRFVSPTAIVFQVPQKLTAAGSVVVSAPSGVSAPFTVAFANVSFGVVANTPGTLWSPAVHGSDLTLVSASNPIVPGETVTMFGVGAGVPSCSLADGAAPATACPTQAPEIQLPDVANSSAPRATASLLPGNVGVARLDIVIPADLPSSVVASGGLRLLIECGDGNSQIVALPLAAYRSHR